MNNYKNVKKPATPEEQAEILWDFVFNFLIHKVKFIDLKVGFILVFLVLILALLGILIAKG